MTIGSLYPNRPEMDRSTPIHEVLFGAFDRHNLGDLLFAHFALGDLREPRTATLAGIVAADLRAYGGHCVESLTAVLDRLLHRPIRLTHVGGEILTCDREVARITTLAPAAAVRTLANWQHDRTVRERWWRSDPAFSTPAPYVVRSSALPAGSQTVFRAVGGVGFAALGVTARRHVVAALREARSVTVRDTQTRDSLSKIGIPVVLERDPVAGIRERFGRQILDRVARIGRGHLAVQVSADFGDDATLDQLAAQIRRSALRLQRPVTFFRAGAAPWHDDQAVLDQLRSRLADLSPTAFGSLDICALIAGAARVIGSSLHVRIVAEAFGRPAISLLGQDTSSVSQAAKVRAYFETWFADAPRLAMLGDLTAVVSAVMAG